MRICRSLIISCILYCCSLSANYAQSIAPDSNQFQKTEPKVGEKLPDINGIDTSKQLLNLYSLQNKWIIVFIYDTACGHCKSVTSELYDFYLRNKDKDLEVFAIPINIDFYSWKNYIKSSHYTWKNAFEAEPQLNLKSDYYVTSTPRLFLGNSQKIIQIQAVPVDVLEEYFYKLINENQLKDKINH